MPGGCTVAQAAGGGRVVARAVARGAAQVAGSRQGQRSGWQTGQYWAAPFDPGTSATMPPQSGHSSPVRPWTAIAAILRALSSSIGTLRCRAKAPPSTLRTALAEPTDAGDRAADKF